MHVDAMRYSIRDAVVTRCDDVPLRIDEDTSDLSPRTRPAKCNNLGDTQEVFKLGEPILN